MRARDVPSAYHPLLARVRRRRLRRPRVRAAAMLRRPARAREVARRIDDRHVAERLREVTQHAARPRIVFLGEQAHIVAQREQSIEEPDRIALATDEAQRVGEPERAG